MDNSRKYRLITRSDFDGVVCAILLRKLGLIDEIIFAHPKDMQDGRVAVSERDISANLPYVEGVHLAFDHHASETIRLDNRRPNHVISPYAASAARVVFDYYGGYHTFPDVSEEMMREVDKADSAGYTIEEILNPRRWALINFITDPRTGIGRFGNFSKPHDQFMLDLITDCMKHSVERVLMLPYVRERIDFYRTQQPLFEQQLKRCSWVCGPLVAIDLRGEEIIHAGNRFLVYALFPAANISMHIMWNKERSRVVLAVGKSIINRTSA
ncbi:MAG: exopolyphosphatase, partial [Negativicutes bacterium]|nr:exopolyphosphatase [Negativicutes bacterium]